MSRTGGAVDAPPAMRRGCAPRKGWLWGGVSVVVLTATAPACTGGDDGGPGPVASEQPWVYLQTTVSAPDGRTSFLQLLESLDDEPDLGNAIELAGNARVFSDGARIFTGSAEEPVIQAWTPTVDGTLAPGERVSFANFGLSFVPFGQNFVGPDKGYLFDGPSARAIIWNPTTLAIRGEIDLSDVVKPDLLPEIDPGVLRGEELFAVVQQNDFGSVNVFRGIQVVVIDTVRDEVVEVFEDTRCVGTFSSIARDDDGTIFVMADNYLVYNWAEDGFPTTCVLRILPGERRFDPDFRLDLDDALGVPASGFFLAGDGVAYTQGMDEQATSLDPRDAPLNFLNEPVATWWRLDLAGAGAPTPLSGLGLTSPRSGPGYIVEGRRFIPLAEAAFAGETRIVELLDDGGTQDLFTVTGLATNLGILQP